MAQCVDLVTSCADAVAVTKSLLSPAGCAACTARDVVIAAQEAAIAGQQAAIAELQAKVERLERLVSRNSGNSSFPPSMDSQPGRTRPQPRPRRSDGSRAPGGQPGSPGSHLAWRDDPDERVAVLPQGRCGCGAPLAAAVDLGVASSHQQAEIPLVRMRVTQYDRHAVRCGCGAICQAPAPAGAGMPGTVTYGPNLQAWCVYLMAAHALPVHRCAQLIGDLAGAAPSAGFVHGLLARAAAAVAVPNRLIRCLVIAAPAVCCDETPIRAGPGPAWRRRHLLVAATPRLTYYALAGRTVAAFASFVLPDLTGVAVHDRYHVYDHPKVGVATHQLCCAHLLRDLEDAAQVYPGARWPAQISTALTALIHTANLARRHGLPAVPAPIAVPLVTAYRQAVTAGLADLADRPPDARHHHRYHRQRLLEDLRDREDDVLRFVTDTRIPPTSNQAERDLRPAKTQDKISGRLRSLTAARDRYAIRGYLSTAAKHGTDILTALRDAITGTPWMPPIPDPF
jgi:transposase